MEAKQNMVDKSTQIDEHELPTGCSTPNCSRNTRRSSIRHSHIEPGCQGSMSEPNTVRFSIHEYSEEKLSEIQQHLLSFMDQEENTSTQESIEGSHERYSRHSVSFSSVHIREIDGNEKELPESEIGLDDNQQGSSTSIEEFAIQKTDRSNLSTTVGRVEDDENQKMRISLSKEIAEEIITAAANLALKVEGISTENIETNAEKNEPESTDYFPLERTVVGDSPQISLTTLDIKIEHYPISIMPTLEKIYEYTNVKKATNVTEIEEPMENISLEVMEKNDYTTKSTRALDIQPENNVSNSPDVLSEIHEVPSERTSTSFQDHLPSETQEHFERMDTSLESHDKNDFYPVNEKKAESKEENDELPSLKSLDNIHSVTSDNISTSPTKEISAESLRHFESKENVLLKGHTKDSKPSRTVEVQVESEFLLNTPLASEKYISSIALDVIDFYNEKESLNDMQTSKSDAKSPREKLVEDLTESVGKFSDSYTSDENREVEISKQKTTEVYAPKQDTEYNEITRLTSLSGNIEDSESVRNIETTSEGRPVISSPISTLLDLEKNIQVVSPTDSSRVSDSNDLYIHGRSAKSFSNEMKYKELLQIIEEERLEKYMKENSVEESEEKVMDVLSLDNQKSVDEADNEIGKPSWKYDSISQPEFKQPILLPMKPDAMSFYDEENDSTAHKLEEEKDSKGSSATRDYILGNLHQAEGRRRPISFAFDQPRGLNVTHSSGLLSHSLEIPGHGSFMSNSRIVETIINGRYFSFNEVHVFWNQMKKECLFIRSLFLFLVYYLIYLILYCGVVHKCVC